MTDNSIDKDFCEMQKELTVLKYRVGTYQDVIKKRGDLEIEYRDRTRNLEKEVYLMRGILASYRHI